MRVSIFSKPFWPSMGGVEASTHILARSLLEQQHTPTVITATVLGGSKEISNEYSIVRNATFFSLLKQFSAADQVIINGGLSVPAALAAWIFKKKLIVWHQMAGPCIWITPGFFGWIRGVLASKLLNYVSLHVGVSAECLASKKLPASAASVVIFNPISPELENATFGSQSTAKDIDILFVGRLIEGKGVLVLADALRRLDLYDKKITVYFAGIGPAAGQIEAILKECQNIHVTFGGRLEFAELAGIYARSRCLVVPSTTHKEGMPLVIAEALGFGLPVVGSDQPVVIEAIADSGLICPQGNGAYLADTLHSLLNDNELRKRLSGAALNRAHLFSYEVFSQKVNRVLEQDLK
jgi:glycosyltransferase involved in cell wall biosynthesis